MDTPNLFLESTPQQMRAAENLLTVEEPKIAAVAVGRLTGEDFYTRLERALTRSNGARLIEGRAVEVEDNGERG
jgi:hypothetical protein